MEKRSLQHPLPELRRSALTHNNNETIKGSFLLELNLTLNFYFRFSVTGLPGGIQKVLQSKGKLKQHKTTVYRVLL